MRAVFWLALKTLATSIIGGFRRAAEMETPRQDGEEAAAEEGVSTVCHRGLTKDSTTGRGG
jgi:hypothetical protein